LVENQTKEVPGLVMSNIAIENDHFGIVDESPLIAWWIFP